MAEFERHYCFISFKTEDAKYKEAIQKKLGDYYIDCSLNEAIDSEDLEYIMRAIREKHLRHSTVTIFLIGAHSNENLGEDEQIYIKRELRASLYDGEGNTRNGILGVVLPNMMEKIYKGSHVCSVCGYKHNTVKINDSTVIKEFSYNYYLPDPVNGCSWGEDDRYCVLVPYEKFIKEPDDWIQKAFDKRSDKHLTDKVRVRF